MIRDFEWAFSFWELISSGSVQCEISQENDMFRISVNKSTVSVDILDSQAMEMVSPFFDHILKPKRPTEVRKRESQSLVLGIFGSLVTRKKEISGYLSMAQELANILAEHKRTLILKEKGRELAKLGYDADSLGMRLLNLKHIEIKDLSALMRLIDQAKIEL